MSPAASRALPGLFGASAPEPGGRVVTRAGGGAGRGGGVPSDGPARSGQPAALTQLLARPGLIIYSGFPRGWGGAERGRGEL